MCRFTHTLVYLCRAQSHVLGAEGDIGIHRLLKKLILRVLEHKSDLVADILSRDFVGIYVLAVNGYLAGGRLEQSVQVLDKCRLARARVSMSPTNWPCGISIFMSSIATFSKGVPAL